MPMTNKEKRKKFYEFCLEKKICIIRFPLERITLDFILSVYDVVLNHKLWQPGFNLLIDLNDQQNIELQSDDFYTIREKHKRMIHKIGNGLWCLIARNDLDYGLSRQFEAIVGELGPRIVIARNEPEAMELLRN
jgi:hypothetical protein